jgi:hypothetical protein
MGSAMAIELCVTLRHGSTKPLPKNRRDGNEAIQSTPGSVNRFEEQRTVARKLHDALIKPRLNGTRASGQRQASDDAQRAHHAFESRPDGQTPAGDLADLVPAKEEPFREEHSDAELGAARSRRSPPHAHHVRDRV